MREPMYNYELFKKIFGLYATELWAKPEKEFLEWLNAKAEKEVKPTVYGEWKYKLIQPSHCVSDMEMTCTRCHAVIRRKHGEWFNFCPMCGADMR